MAHIAEHKKLHLIGVGGCSMSGLACILNSRGYEVRGSDRIESPFTRRLEELGIPVVIGHDAANLSDAELVIYSAAIKPDNPERVEASRRGIPQIERSEALGQITEGYENVVGIAGCHGKTTITSMLALICEKCGPDATVHVGGFVDFLNGGVRLGGHDTFITEACEYVESFLTLSPTTVLINNIDNDHLDYYGDMEHIVAAFEKFAGLLPENGLLIACTDDRYVKPIYDGYGRRKLSYGLDGADYVPGNIVYDDEGCPSFDLVFRGEKLCRIALSVPGEHNVINAMAAAAVAISMGCEPDGAASALAEFRNTRRRFEYFGEKNGVKVYHDYAHHPAEIAATLSAASRMKHRRLIAVFQCNSYTRARTLFCGDMSCMRFADEVLVPDIYPGREKDDGSVHARDMADAINRSCGNAKYMATFDEIAAYLEANAHPGDVVVTLGSGDVYTETRKLVK